MVHLDDILIYTNTKEEHMKFVRAMLEKLWKVQLFVKLSKCDFHKTSLDYLANQFLNDGIEMILGRSKHS